MIFSYIRFNNRDKLIKVVGADLTIEDIGEFTKIKVKMVASSFEKFTTFFHLEGYERLNNYVQPDYSQLFLF